MPTPSNNLTRRTVLSAGLAALATTWSTKGQDPHPLLASKTPMLLPKAKSLILLVTQGGMSQMDTFDPKPALEKYHGKKLTPEILPGVDEVKTFFGGKDGSPLLKSPYKFSKRGQSAMDVSELFPHLGNCVDDSLSSPQSSMRTSGQRPGMLTMKMLSGLRSR